MDTIYEEPSSGAGDEKELFKEPRIGHEPTSWSPDGRFLLYNTVNAVRTGYDLWVLPLAKDAAGERKPVLLLGAVFNEWGARFSPDGHWIAYVTNETGHREIFVRSFIASGPSGVPAVGEGKWQITKDGGNYPKWRADGKELIYDDFPESYVKTAVEVNANGSVLEFGTPQRLFPGSDGFRRLGRHSRRPEVPIQRAPSSAALAAHHHRAELARAFEKMNGFLSPAGGFHPLQQIAAPPGAR